MESAVAGTAVANAVCSRRALVVVVVAGAPLPAMTRATPRPLGVRDRGSRVRAVVGA